MKIIDIHNNRVAYIRRDDNNVYLLPLNYRSDDEWKKMVNDWYDDRIEFWHRAPESQLVSKLSAWLGMTDEEYAAWVKDPKVAWKSGIDNESPS